MRSIMYLCMGVPQEYGALRQIKQLRLTFHLELRRKGWGVGDFTWQKGNSCGYGKATVW